nr:MAG TPA: hypothetical protein [Caudoviricetes sp.]
MKYTAIIIASAAFAFCVQAYAKAQAYMDYTTASAIGVDAIDPYENIRDDIARHEMQEAARITREREVEIAQMYEQLTAGERMRGDAEVK